MNKLEKFIKSKDIFGHDVKLNFHKSNSTHRTLLGGLLSIICYIAILDIVVNKFLTMSLRDNSKISMYTEHYNVEEGDGIHFNQTKMQVYHVLKKQLDHDGPVLLNEETSRYLDIFFAQEKIN
jgi:hypothetical protein